MNRKTLTVLTGAFCAAAATGAALIPVAAGAAPRSPAAAPPAAAIQCDRGAWAGRVQGAPADFESGNSGGDYLWHDTNGFHLRVTHKNDDRVLYTGQISSPAAMRIDPVRLEKGDSAQLSADRHTLSFTFADYGHIDGVDFHTDCASHIVATHLTAGNQLLSSDRVYLGAHEIHPAQIPFTLHRHDAT